MNGGEMRSFLTGCIVALLGSFFAGVVKAQAPAAGTVVQTVKETVKVKKRHAVIKANTLWDMAKFYYEDPFKWPVIYDANKDRIKDPHWIYPGQTFIIPGLDKMVTVVKELPQPVAPPSPPPAPEPEEEPEEEPIEYYSPEENSHGAIVVPDDLSVELPQGMGGQQPAMYRMKMDDQWVSDGTVTEFRGRESMAAAGDMISVKMNAALRVRKRQRYAVYRRVAASESDVQEEGKYYQKVGLVEIMKQVSKKEYRARILKSGGSVQLNDVLKLEE